MNISIEKSTLETLLNIAHEHTSQWTEMLEAGIYEDDIPQTMQDTIQTVHDLLYPPQSDKKKVTYVCKYCKSDDLSFDAIAQWDADNQVEVLHSTYDSCYCQVCEGETRTELVEYPSFEHLFDNPDSYPEELVKLCNEMGERDDLDYKELKEWQAKFEQVGYTFDYDLSATPFDLKKIND